MLNIKAFFASLLLLSLVLLAFWYGKAESQLLGKWKMVRVIEGTRDISDKLNPNHDRWIQFRENRSFESGGTPYGKNTGTYTLDEEQMTLFLESDAGEGDNSHWRIRFKQDSMIWQGIGSERQESTRVFYTRAVK